MALELRKGDRITPDILKKGNKGEALKVVRLGLSWEMKPGLDADLDASVVLLSHDGKMWAEDSIVYYGILSSKDGAINHTGDVREGHTGDDAGDDENIMIDLTKVSLNTQMILAVITSYSEGEPVRFGRVKNASVNLYSEVDGDSRKLCGFDLSEDMSSYTSMEMAKLYRDGDSWGFEAVGNGLGSDANGLVNILKKYSKWFP